METVDANRLKIWQALSEFFLDTEITDSTFDYVARVVLDTGYSPQEIHSILWGEVFPALEGNLKSIAGEWAGWTCLLYTSPSPRDRQKSRMPSSA